MRPWDFASRDSFSQSWPRLVVSQRQTSDACFWQSAHCTRILRVAGIYFPRHELLCRALSQIGAPPGFEPGSSLWRRYAVAHVFSAFSLDLTSLFSVLFCDSKFGGTCSRRLPIPSFFFSVFSGSGPHEERAVRPLPSSHSTHNHALINTAQSRPRLAARFAGPPCVVAEEVRHDPWA